MHIWCIGRRRILLKAADKKALKRESIIQTALQLFSTNGFHKTTIPDIARKLGMSVGNRSLRRAAVRSG